MNEAYRVSPQVALTPAVFQQCFINECTKWMFS